MSNDEFKENIEIAQAKLKSLGLYDDVIDGFFGENTLGALNTLIEKSGLKMNQSEAPKAPAINGEIPWISEARKHIGTKEIKGSAHNKKILDWVKNLGGWFTDDETPWCGTFIAQCLKQNGRGVPKHWYRALAYESYGTKLLKPAYGCIGVMSRTGGGHVTFIVGASKDGKYLIGLGGNQSDAVNLMKFPVSRFTAWVWPELLDGVKSSPYPSRYNLPIYSDNLQVSTKES